MCRGAVGVAICLGLLSSGVVTASNCDPDEGMYKRLMRHEGVERCAYVDTLGNPTIGVGHLLRRPVPDNLCWSRQRIMDVFHLDVHRASESAARIMPRWAHLSSLRREVFTELDFQIGPHRLHGFRRMLRAVHGDDWEVVAQELLDSRLAHQTPSRTQELACLLTIE